MKVRLYHSSVQKSSNVSCLRVKAKVFLVAQMALHTAVLIQLVVIAVGLAVSMNILRMADLRCCA